MNDISPLITALLIGLFGGTHCLAMCGSLVSALSLAQQGHFWRLQAGYHLGRISSYVLAGALAGSFGLLMAQFIELDQLRWILSILAALFMIALGLYLGGWWQGIARIERWGGLLWRRIEPWGRGLFPVRHFKQALLLGLLWGWLPCGLVYSALVLALSSGQTGMGAGIMLAFALGTLPNLLLMGSAAQRLKQWLQKPHSRQWAGAAVILLGILSLVFVTI